jgi:hypothetical protein
MLKIKSLSMHQHGKQKGDQQAFTITIEDESLSTPNIQESQ